MLFDVLYPTEVTYKERICVEPHPSVLVKQKQAENVDVVLQKDIVFGIAYYLFYSLLSLLGNIVSVVVPANKPEFPPRFVGVVIHVVDAHFGEQARPFKTIVPIGPQYLGYFSSISLLFIGGESVHDQQNEEQDCSHLYLCIGNSWQTIIIIQQMSHRASDLNKTKRAQSVKKLTLEKLKEVPQFNEISMKVLVQQIIKYLIEIIQTLLQEQNSNNYLAFMAMNEKMNKQLQRKVVNIIGQKCSEIKSQFIDKIDQIQRVKHNKEKKEYRNQLKNQRKNITQNILAYHRSNSFNSQGHRSHQVQKDRQNQTGFAEEEDKARQIGSIQLTSLQSKLSAIEEAQSQNNKWKEALQKMQKKFDQNCRDIKLMAQRHVQFKLGFEEKLELSLQSLWNVISDNQSKICQIERAVQQLAIS